MLLPAYFSSFTSYLIPLVAGYKADLEFKSPFCLPPWTRATGSGGIRAGESWELSEPETPPSVLRGCWHPGGGASTGSVSVWPTRESKPHCLLIRMATLCQLRLPYSEDDLTHWELIWGPPFCLSYKTKHSSLAAQFVHHRRAPITSPLWASSLSFSTWCTFRSHLTSYLRGSCLTPFGGTKRNEALLSMLWDILMVKI